MVSSNTLVHSNGNMNNFGIPIKNESAINHTSIYSLPSPLFKRKGPDVQYPAGKRHIRNPSDVSPTLGNDEFVGVLQDVSAGVAQAYQGQLHHPRQHDAVVAGSQHSHEEAAARARGFTTDPHLSMRLLSLPVLDSLSTQILSTLARGSYHETINTVTQPESELGQAFAVLKSLFDDTKKIYYQLDQDHNQFLSADGLGIYEPSHRATIRITNVATFASSVFQGQDIGFYEANDRFLDIFTPEGGTLGFEAGELYLNFKTQMYLSSLQLDVPGRSKEDILEDLFPQNLYDSIASRQTPGTLSKSELDFITSCKARREYFMGRPTNPESIQYLSEQFSWESFLRQLKIHLINAYALIVDPYMKRYALTAPASPLRPPAQNLNHDQFGMQTATGTNDIAAPLEHTSHQSYGFAQQDQSRVPPQRYRVPTQNNSSQPQYSNRDVPQLGQSAPTHILYEEARRVAVSKSHPATRRPGVVSARRPWTTEEEKTLMAGLDQVKGPHWSQILSLYGKGGSINDVLKHRNQVQLKDKARNLKLFFLKNHVEVPLSFVGVTGDLKTRAPSSVAKKKAEEREKIASSEEQARMATVMALANGLQSSPDTELRDASASVSETPSGSPQENSSSPEDEVTGAALMATESATGALHQTTI